MAPQQDLISRNHRGDGRFAPMDLTPKTPEKGFCHECDDRNLAKIEDLLQRQAPPKWPEEAFERSIERRRPASRCP
jgi:hypothetical protein